VSETLAFPKKIPLLLNRQYLLLWFGQSLSLLGDYFFRRPSPSGSLIAWRKEKAGFRWQPAA
jgi:hypothetical protein